MQVEFLGIHIAYVNSQVLIPGGIYFEPLRLRLANTIRGGGYQKTDRIPVDITAESLLNIFNLLGGLNERYAAAINQAMKEDLQDQLEAMAPTQEVAIVAQAIAAADAAKNQFLENAETEGWNYFIT